MRVLWVLMVCLALCASSSRASTYTLTLRYGGASGSPGVMSYASQSVGSGASVSGYPASVTVSGPPLVVNSNPTVTVTVPASVPSGTNIPVTLTYASSSGSCTLYNNALVTTGTGTTGTGTTGTGTSSTGTTGTGTTGTTGTGTGSTGGTGGTSSAPCSNPSMGDKYALGFDGGATPCDYLAASVVHKSDLAPILKAVLALCLALLAVWQGPRLVKMLFRRFSDVAASGSATGSDAASGASGEAASGHVPGEEYTEEDYRQAGAEADEFDRVMGDYAAERDAETLHSWDDVRGKL